jgi:hypothetical protein
MGFFGDPTKVLIRPEKPDFFLKTPGPLGSLDSSEYRFEVLIGASLMRVACDFSDMVALAAEKLAEWRRVGLMIR